MANRWKGNFVVATEATSSGTDYTGKANGAWSLNNQIQQKQANLWAKGVNIPSAPTIGTATAGNTNASVTFTAPSNNGGTDILNYTALSNPGALTANATQSPITVSGLTNGTTYSFTVTATNISGVSLQSSSSNSVTPVALIVPDAPTITGVTVTSGSATISFTAPAFSGSSAILSYTATSSGGQTATVTQSGSGTVTVSGLTNFNNYTFTVKATNAAGSSLASNTSASVSYPSIGDSYAGGYYGGKINSSGTIYALIVAPKATGNSSTAKTFGPSTTTTNITSGINGPTNSASLAALGAAYGAAIFAENLTIGGYTDWYLPARYELEVLYYFLKPSTTSNIINALIGPNPHAVSPEPVNTVYTASSPAQTSATIFRTGGAETFSVTEPAGHCSSTESSVDRAWTLPFTNGELWANFKTSSCHVRAIRRVAI